MSIRIPEQFEQAWYKNDKRIEKRLPNIPKGAIARKNVFAAVLFKEHTHILYRRIYIDLCIKFT